MIELNLTNIGVTQTLESACEVAGNNWAALVSTHNMIGKIVAAGVVVMVVLFWLAMMVIDRRLKKIEEKMSTKEAPNEESKG